MFLQYFAGEFFNFAKGNCFKTASAFKAKAEAADAAEKIEDAKLGHATALACTVLAISR